MVVEQLGVALGVEHLERQSLDLDVRSGRFRYTYIAGRSVLGVNLWNQLFDHKVMGAVAYLLGKSPRI
jgi:hypothetical protein